MARRAANNTVDLLRYFHENLSAHFTALHAARNILELNSPVFALEHNLPHDDLDNLKMAVRSAVQAGLGDHYRQWWLPFVVYAAESGYDYVGPEYWRSFEESTPGWHSDQRHWIKTWYRKFADNYGGAVPSGAFASNFTIISWPITHAVLPTYLQRQLAQLLFEFSGALTSQLLDDPAALGIRLARRASNYTERFRIFCENTNLVGQVATALLSGENEPTPYLSEATLTRIVNGLSREQQSRHWLKTAQQSASRVRDLLPDRASPAVNRFSGPIPRERDPRLFLRHEGKWNAYAELPNLTALGADHPQIYRQLRISRATVSGSARPVPPSGLLYPRQEVRFSSWPRTDQPFIQLNRGDEQTNQILANQCAITYGPWWLFRRHRSGVAIETKGKIVRPGHDYILIGSDSLAKPNLPWITETNIEVQGVRAYELTVPPQLREDESSALLNAGLRVVSHVAIRPVGVVASSWDGEGEVELMAGEPAILGIRSDLLPTRCCVLVNDSSYSLEWPPNEKEIFFALDGLPVGTHELNFILFGNGNRQLTSGIITIAIREPEAHPEGASTGEGIRLIATPTRPTISELWDNRAMVTIDGPLGAKAELRVALENEKGELLIKLQRQIQLPIEKKKWQAIAKSIRADKLFSSVYDTAEFCALSVIRDGVGFATLTCERGFQPLRWSFNRNHDGQVTAKLVDRTDGGSTTFDFYDIEAPLVAVPKDPIMPFEAPPRGGLVIAKAGSFIAAAVLPTNPNTVFRLDPVRPIMPAMSRSARDILHLAENHRRWTDADLPADPFAVYEQQIFGDAIARTIGTLIGGRHWAAIEQKLTRAEEIVNHLDEMQDAVGISTEHKALASAIAYSLYKWLKPEDLLIGFHEVIKPYLASNGLINRLSIPRFLLELAGRPGGITEWDANDSDFILNRVLQSPVLYRAARFAVLGTRALNDAEGVERGF
ncbi:hypothetical protein [Nocardiopsis protaetiae]|uniref:hypothetical protein n=1 Tax=Nocardiopsis protaetiae TaxID=3382270 RepID=UPI00387B6332